MIYLTPSRPEITSSAVEILSDGDIFNEKWILEEWKEYRNGTSFFLHIIYPVSHNFFAKYKKIRISLYFWSSLVRFNEDCFRDLKREGYSEWIFCGNQKCAPLFNT